MVCQKKTAGVPLRGIAKKIIEKEANYVLALKNNHKKLYEEVKGIFDSLLKGGAGRHARESKEIRFDYFTTVDINHGRT